MERHIERLENDIKNFPKTDDSQDKFVQKIMYGFSKHSREQYEKLSIMHKNMQKLYESLGSYFAFDPHTVSIEDFFIELANFRTLFLEAVKENHKKREMEEKIKRAKLAKEKAEREKQERQQKKKQLIDMNKGTVELPSWSFGMLRKLLNNNAGCSLRECLHGVGGDDWEKRML
ncbi:DIAP2 protein, partial [Amia calva]|nr:DIAP2 protein [Amia calva]